MDRISAFGLVIRRARTDLKMSVRALARQVGCTHVHLGEVERGRRALIGDQYWPKLALVLHLDLADLEEAAERSKVVELETWTMTASAARFAQSFARRANRLTPQQCDELLAVLGEDDEGK